jgi:hypothetical protein
MPKRTREYEEQEVKRFCQHPVSLKRKCEEEDNGCRKRQKNITGEYVDRLEKDNRVMMEACAQAGHAIDRLNQRVKELETLLHLQRTQMERIRLNNDIRVY